MKIIALAMLPLVLAACDDISVGNGERVITNAQRAEWARRDAERDAREAANRADAAAKADAPKGGTPVHVQSSMDAVTPPDTPQVSIEGSNQPTAGGVDGPSHD